MTANNLQTNTFVGGMNMDADKYAIPNNSYRYAENVRVITNDEGTTGVLQNIEGVKKYNLSIPSDEVVIGTTTVSNMAIVFTRLSDGRTRVYKVTNFDSATPTTKVILQGQLGLCQDLDTTPNLSVVANYESDQNIKVYFTDGNSGIKVLSVDDTTDYKYAAGSDLVDSSGNIINTLALDIQPGCTLPPFKLQRLDFGNLPTGVVQYCYQLFNLYGTETTTSSLSGIVHLTQSVTSSDSKDYKGSYLNESSNKACILTTDLITKDFNRCRVFRILYQENNDLPLIHVIDEIEISSDQDAITYVDKGNSYMAEISVDEFNSMTGYQFTAKSIAKMQNMLFAANVTDDTWDVEYDARAYRANNSGQVRLESSDSADTITFNISSVASTNVPENHDCINPYNYSDYANTSASARYMYDKNGDLGGSGKNIDYVFETVPFYLSDNSNLAGSRLDDCSMNVSSTNMSQITATSSDGGTHTISLNGNEQRIPNYADPYLSYRFKSYQRDEVYRFGIIFYNRKNIPSPVHWIADIKMPHNVQMNSFTYEGRRLVAHPLGVRFTVRNIPTGVTGYEIVRCDRTEADRSVIMQVATSRVYQYDVLENNTYPGSGDIIENSIEMRPPFIFTNYHDDIYSVVNYESRAHQAKLPLSHQVDDYLKIVSPEICVSGEDSANYIDTSTYLDIQGVMYSPGQNFSESYSDVKVDINDDITPVSIFANADKTMQSDGSIYTWIQKSNVFLRNDYRPVIYLACGGEDSPDISFPGYVSKYFRPYYLGEDSSMQDVQYSIADKVYPPIIPYNAYEGEGVLSAYKVNIGERTYTNWSITDVGKEESVFGPAGPCIVLQVPNLGDGFLGMGVGDALDLETYGRHAINGIAICNVKRQTLSAYGGNTYTSRQNSVYIPVNEYNRMTGSSTYYSDTFGGDTYLGLLDYPNQMIFQANDAEKNPEKKAYIGAYIPFESSINMQLLAGDMAHMSNTGDDYLDTHLQLEPTQLGTYHSQDRPFFAYNSVYSVQQGNKQYVPKSIYSLDNIHYGNRIHVSQAKTANEVVDSWATFKVADYLDVDNQYGDISNLKVFKDRLFYFQDSALGIAAVNERSLISDGNAGALLLGTGGILTRFDYITTLNGSSIINDRSIVNSDNVLYWYDYDKNEICAYQGGVHQISKELNVQSYLNEMYTSKRDVTLSLYDKKYNEVWFRFYDKSLIFNEQLGKFTSFYTFNPDWALSFSNKIVTIKDNSYYVLNSLDVDGLSEYDKSAIIDIIINKDYPQTKVFDNILFDAQLLDQNGADMRTGLIDSIKFYTKGQEATATNPAFDYREDTYRLPIPRQTTDDPSTFAARLRGKYLECIYSLDANDEKTFKIPYINTTYRYSLV